MSEAWTTVEPVARTHPGWQALIGFAGVSLGFAVPFAVVGFVALWRARRPAVWAAVSGCHAGPALPRRPGPRPDALRPRRAPGHGSLRYVGLAILAVTVVKVFAIDTAELSNLYRFVSLSVLGLALVAITHFYKRFVAPPGSPAVPGGTVSAPQSG